MPVDASLYANGGALGFLKGAQQGLQLGNEIAGMPNAAEKLKAAHLLTQNSIDAMNNPDKGSSKAYSMGPNGPQFQGSNAEMSQDVANRQRLGQAEVGGKILSNQMMPIVGATAGQQASGKTALGGDAPGTYNNSGGENAGVQPAVNPDGTPGVSQTPANQPTAGGGGMPVGGSPNAGGSANASTGSAPGSTALAASSGDQTNDATAPSSGAPSQGGSGGNADVSPGTQYAQTGGGAPPDGSVSSGGKNLVIPKPTPRMPGGSLFKPEDVKNWWTSNWGDTATSVQFSPTYNNGKGGWVVSHKDGSKDVVDDDVILANKNHWNPTPPFADQLKMAHAMRQAPDPSAQSPGGAPPTSGLSQPQNPLDILNPGLAAQRNVDATDARRSIGQPAPMPGAAAPRSNPVTPAGVSVPGAPPTAAPLAPGAAPSATASNLPVPTGGAQDLNAADFGATRKVIGRKGNAPIFQPDLGQPYVVTAVAQDGTETRSPLNGVGQTTQATPYSTQVKLLQAKNAMDIQKSMVEDAVKKGADPVLIQDPVNGQAYLTDYLNKQNLLAHKIDPGQAENLRSMAEAMTTGYKLSNQLADTDPAKIGAAAQFGNSLLDKGQGLPFGWNKFVPKPDQSLAQINTDFELYKKQAGRAFNKGKYTSSLGKGIDESLGNATQNPGTAKTRIDGTLSTLGPQFVNEVRGEIAEGRGVPDDILQAANAVEAQLKKGAIPGGTGAARTNQTPVNQTAHSTAPMAAPPPGATQVITKADEAALAPNTPYVGKNKDGLWVWAYKKGSQ